VEELGLLGEDGAVAQGGAVAAGGRRNQRVEGERPVSVFDKGQGRPRPASGSGSRERETVEAGVQWSLMWVWPWVWSVFWPKREQRRGGGLRFFIFKGRVSLV